MESKNKAHGLYPFYFFAAFIGGFFLWSSLRTTPPQSSELASLSVPSAQDAIPISPDLLLDTQQFLQFVNNPQKFTHQTCAPFLHEVLGAIEQKDPGSFNYALTRQNYLAIIQNLWSIRLSLHDRLRELTQNGDIHVGATDDPCVNAIRDTFRAARYLEDFLGESFLGIPNFNEKTDPKAINTLQGDAPHLLKAPGVETVTLRSGDMILSRGTAYTSAAIARIGTVRSQFSHLAVIYIENEPLGKEFTIPEAMTNPHVKVLEAHIEVGSTIRPFKDYVADGNARNVLFRYSDASVANEAAKWAHDFIVQHRIEQQRKNGGAIDDPNNNVPYDFKMNLGDLSEIFCSEMGFIAYRSVGIILPQFPSILESHNDVVRTLGITRLLNFAPGDLEFDTRFQYLAEWRDYRKMHDIRYKDAVLDSMFDWMRDKNYQLHSTVMMEGKAIFGWMIRHAEFAKTTLPKNMSTSVLRMTFTINQVGDILANDLAQIEKKHQSDYSGRLMTYPEVLDALEKFRAQDTDLYTANHVSKFHQLLHSQAEFNLRRENTP